MKCKTKFLQTKLKLSFSSISHLPSPIVVIHSEDDAIIPYFHYELVNSFFQFKILRFTFFVCLLKIKDYVKKHRDVNLPAVRFITVPRSAGCGHNHIYSYPKFQELVR